MNIEVHFGGHFKQLQGKKTYEGGSCKEIREFETDTMSWFELRYMLKKIGVVSDYNVLCLRPKEELDSGLELVNSDKCVLRIMTYLDVNQNVVLYIEHLVKGSDRGLLLPDYCLPEKGDPVHVVPSQSVNVETPSKNVQSPGQRQKFPVGRKALAHKPPISERFIPKKMTTKEQRRSPFSTPKKVASGVKINSPSGKGSPSTPKLSQPKNNRRSPRLFKPGKSDVGDEDHTAESWEEFKNSFDEMVEKMCSDIERGLEERKEGTSDVSKHVSTGDNLEGTSDVSKHAPCKGTSSTEPEQANVSTGDNLEGRSTRPEHTVVDEMGEKSNADEGGEKDGAEKQGDEGDKNDEDSLEDVDSDYLPSDSLHTPSSSDCEGVSSAPRYSEYPVESMNSMAPEFEVGMQFESPGHFRASLRNHAIEHGYDLLWKKNEGVRIIVKCKAVGCPFRIYCSWNSDRTRYCVKSLNGEHKCSRALSNAQVKKRWLAKKYLEHFRSDPNMKWNVLKDTVQRDIGVSISRDTCYRVRNLALEEINGKDFFQFQHLWDYSHVLLKNNPGSFIKVKTRPIPNDANNVQFETMFVSFAAMLKGLLKGCRPVIGMDGCHLSSLTGGILLSAISRDPNDQMFPVAYAVVEVENKQTWSWFITTLLEALGVENVQGWTFICDRQKGLVESLKLHVPRADVRFCVRHLYANFKDKYKGLILKRLLWKAAGSYTVEGHVNAMAEIRSLNVEAYEYLEAIEKPLWVRSYFNTSPKCDMLTNNISEAFNKFILAARDKPILTMLEMIRRLLMSRFEKKRTAAQSSQSHGRKIVEKLKSMADGARNCQPYLAGQDLFEVVEKDKQFVVNLNNSTCTCRQWVMTGIPCRHAVCCIQYRRLKTEDFVHEYYSKERYMLAYQEMIYPITDQSTWEKQQCLNILPLKLRRQPGRPKKARNKAADESPKKHVMSKKGTIVRCSKCKQIGHNVRKCKNEATIKKNENVRNEATIKKENKKREKPESSKNQPSSQQASTGGSSVSNVDFSQQSNTGPLLSTREARR